MAPNLKEAEHDESEWNFEVVHEDPANLKPRPPIRIVWRNVILFTILHTGAVAGLYLAFTSTMIKTNLFLIILAYIAGFGVTAGVHRLWSHRSYKAKTSLRIFLMLCNCVTFQNDILEWSRDHRVHHKFSETDADPHNANRGFFFAHVGWLLCKKHPDVIEKGRTIDLSDLWADPVVRFQRRHFLKLGVLMNLFLPTWIPWYFWGETFWNSLLVCVFLRYCWTLNNTWLVNSAAHLWGHSPYDKNIMPRENIWVSFGGGGEGWHNYHHTFPMDYKAAELPYFFNTTTMFINIWAKMGLAYDLKSVPKHIIEKRKQRTGS